MKSKHKGNKNSFRKPEHDYRLPGYYLITINTYLKQPFFGEIKEHGIFLSSIGEITLKTWHQIPDHEPTMELDEFILMPDHLHGIIHIMGNAYDVLEIPEKLSFQPESHSLSIIIRNYKAAVTRITNRTIKNPPAQIWQRSFHDRIIHNKQGLEIARWYIRNNIAEWQKNHPH